MGTLLLAAAVIALVWANSPWSAGYENLGWLDVSVLASPGRTGLAVSLLIGELAYGKGVHADPARIGILAGSFTAAVLPTVGRA